MEQKGATIAELKNIIDELKKTNTNEDLLFGRGDNYKMYKTIFEGNEIKEIKEILLNTIKSGLNVRTLENYDLEISCDDTIEIVDSKLVKEYERIINNSSDESTLKIINEETKFDKINFLYFKIQNPNNGTTITIFKKLVKPQTVLRQAMKVLILGKKMKRVKENVLFLDSTVSSFEYNGKFYIFDRNRFNSLFKFRDMYNILIDNNSKKIRDCKIIDQPEAFLESCKKNGHFVKKISKLIISQGLKNVKENKERIPQIIKNRNLKLNLDENNQIVYEEGKIKEILDLLLDNYVKTELTDRNAIAKALSYEGEEQ